MGAEVNLLFRECHLAGLSALLTLSRKHTNTEPPMNRQLIAIKRKQGLEQREYALE